jgi:ubiquinone/menaquinone biosynthesis C-methylase UbiE
VKSILMRAFGRPEGILGKLGGIIMARTNQKMAARAIELLDVRSSDQVLEVGFGPGVGIQLLAAKVLTGRVAGIDRSEEMLKQATARNAVGIEKGRVDVRGGSAESLPFENATFDKALAINSMQVWGDAMAGLREIRRVLKSGGRVALGFTRFSRQPKAGLSDVVTAAGFVGVQVLDVDRDFVALATKP